MTSSSKGSQSGIDARTAVELVALGRLVAESDAGLALAGEGNLSGPAEAGIRVVTASGTRLGELSLDQLVQVRVAPLAAAVDTEMDDHEWLEVILSSRVAAEDLRPTVEVALHAVIAELMGEVWIVHAHPVDVLAIACSEDLADFAETRLFPDHAVALGRADLWLPYVDPGRPLAVAVRDGMASHERQYGSHPVSIILANHGAFVVGSTPREALDRMLMLAKAARVFLRGGRRGLSSSQIGRILGREDEAYRQALLRDGSGAAAPTVS